MTVPTWSKIFDSEIDPESPITSSLIFRLRDNICAVLGIDPASVTVPTVPYPQSQIRCRRIGKFVSRPTSLSYATTSENLVCAIGAAMEKNDIQNAQAISPAATPPITQVVPEFPYSIQLMTDTQLQDTWLLSGPYITYVGGVPDSLDLQFIRDISQGSATYSGTLDATSGVIQLPLDNAYHPILSGGSACIQAKARATSTDIYLQMEARINVSGARTLYPQMNFININYSYEAKA